MQNQKIRQPIITVVGHVDHGKSSVLDNLRGTCYQEQEAGGITQKISFTLLPPEKILSRCPIFRENKELLEIPGFLFIDTPGHAAFTNLRKRGGALADLAILVIDINEGIKPQTAEVIEILKSNKTPFIIALNKIDNISGWKRIDQDLKKNIDSQAIPVKQNFEEKFYTLIGALHSHGFESDLFFNVNDFTSKIVLVPCSAKTGEGIPELLTMICGLSQKFLKSRITLGKDAKGVILEIKKQKSMSYAEVILYDGILKVNDEIAIATFGDPLIGKIRVLEEIIPLSQKFKTTFKASAATGLRIQFKDFLEVLPGMPFQVIDNNFEEIKSEFKKQVGEKVKTDSCGIIIKADSLGSLEALLYILKQEGIKVCNAGIGNIDKKDVICANANLNSNELDAIILGFNVSHEEDISEVPHNKIKIMQHEVIYKLIEDLKEYREQKFKEIEKQKLMKLASVCKIKILHEYVFHNSNPAIFGVKIEQGRLRENTKLMDEQGNDLERVKRIQKDKKAVQETFSGDEVAISLSGTNYERHLKDLDCLYSSISEGQFKNFKKNKDLLSREEIMVLQKIAQIKRAKDPSWGVG